MGGDDIIDVTDRRRCAMLTRLKVNGFKNLVEVDVRFGPFTCVAGANGVGKSNLFDAITFLSALADKSLVDAAASVRAEKGGRLISEAYFTASAMSTMM
jgi:AAA15 family ATPase/GTPase